MDFVCRDYVYSWYRKLGSSQEFPVEVRTTLARVLSILAEKMGEVSNFSSCDAVLWIRITLMRIKIRLITLMRIRMRDRF
jgi:hypothetical protein